MYNILVFLSLIFGGIIGHFTEEEIKLGKKYFLAIEKVLLFITAFTLLIVNFSFFSLFIFLGVLLGIAFRLRTLFLGFGVFLSNYISIEFSLLIGSLAFIYFLVYSRDLQIKDVISDVALFLLPFSLFFVESFIKANSSVLLSISAGALLAFIGPVAQLGRATEKMLKLLTK